MGVCLIHFQDFPELRAGRVEIIAVIMILRNYMLGVSFCAWPLICGLVVGAGVARAGTVIYSNGPFVSDPGAGIGGADASVLRDGLGTFGLTMSSTIRAADDFVVPAGEIWNITGLRVFGYQTGSTTTSTFTALRAQIWDARPGDPGASVIWGNLTDNILSGSAFTGVYRVTSDTLTNAQRPVMQLDGSVTTLLTAGRYWVEWGAAGSLASGPFAPPITISGQAVTGNARQYNSGWINAVANSGDQQGLPFEFSGVVMAAPEPGGISAVLVMFGSVVSWRRRRVI
jgi:hypothetical protein